MNLPNMIENIAQIRSELQNVGILVYRIPDIFGRKSGYFPIFGADLSIFGIKRLDHN